MPLPGQVEVDPIGRDRSPSQMLCESLFVWQKTNAIRMEYLEVEA